jgi:hypothetical protein
VAAADVLHESVPGIADATPPLLAQDQGETELRDPGRLAATVMRLNGPRDDRAAAETAP